MIGVDRLKAPPFQLSTNYKLTSPEVITSAQGIRVFAFRGLEQNAVKVEWLFPAGKWHETKTGLSHFASQMLPKGTLKKDSFTLAEQLDSLGAHLEITPGFDEVTVALYALRKNLTAALAVMEEIFSEPSFDREELEQMKEIYVQTLRVNNEKTNVVASKEIRKAVFGSIHPYGASLEEADIRPIQRQDLEKFYRMQFSLQSAFVVGKVTDAELEEIVGIAPRGSVSLSVEPAVSATAGHSISVAMPGKIQSSIRLGKRTVARRNDPSYFDAVMFNHVLGGFFGSRLMKNIREEKGLTYGIHSSLHHFVNDSFWLIGAEVNQQNVAEAIREIKVEIKRLQEDPIPVDELEIARNYFIGSWQSENSSLFSVAEKYRSLYSFGLPDNYYQNLLEHIQHLEPAGLQRAAQLFHTDDWVEVVVG